jgi:6-phosphogluconolactonase (cycloisomerase 2 family)
MSKSHALQVRCAIAFLVIAVLTAVSAKPAAAQDESGAVYVLTNQAANSVMVYARAANGALSLYGAFMTGGMGSGSGPDPLGSQGALVLDQRQGLLFAVNGGSNDVSVFAMQGLGLRLLDREPSGGQMPVSVAVRGGLVYVLNAGSTPNIQGFTIQRWNGHLVPLPGSMRMLAGGVGSGPAEVAFSPSGDVLIVTEKNTSQIDTWSVNDDGYAMHRVTTPSHGGVPFGFTFTRRDIAIVSEAMPSALSSYEVDADGELELVTGTESDGQAANCWVVVTRNGHYAFTTNTGTGNISSYLVAREGDLTLLDATAGITGAGTAPIDMALSNGSQFLYVRDGLKGMVDGFRVGSDGSLTPVGSVGGVPAGAQGLAAR